MSFYHHTTKISTSKSYCAEQKTGIKECVILDTAKYKNNTSGSKL